MAAGYCREEEIIFEGQHNVYTLLQFISEKYGGQMKKNISSLLKGEKNIIWVFINGHRIKDDDYHLNLKEGDVVVLTTPLLVGG
jgi:hypothetical protein